MLYGEIVPPPQPLCQRDLHIIALERFYALYFVTVIKPHFRTFGKRNVLFGLCLKHSAYNKVPPNHYHLMDVFLSSDFVNWV